MPRTSFSTSLPGFSASPSALTLNPGERTRLAVTFTAAAGRGYGDQQGYLVLTGANGHNAHLPAWARVRYAQPLADVLIIDNDGSELGFPDYLWYYTDTVAGLGYTYHVISTLSEDVPDATTLAAYRAVILFSGDNYWEIMGQNAQNRLVEYLNGGGSLIVLGQDLATVLTAAQLDPPPPFRNFLYVYRLGANWVQDSVSGGTTPRQFIVPTSSAPAALANLRVDLTQPHLFTTDGDLTGAQETPPVATNTTGNFAFQYNVDQQLLTYAVTVVPTNTEPITLTGAHLQLGAPGVDGPVVRDLDQGAVLPILVTDTLTVRGVISDLRPVEIGQLLDNAFYINLPTTRNTDGELRGQLTPLPLPNQPYVDEIDNRFHDGSQDPAPDNTTSESNLASQLILRYAGPDNIFDGAVAVAHRDQPSLERPGVDYAGRSIYATFGLEGMNESLNPTLGYTPTTRVDLLGTFLTWSWSEAGTAKIENITAPNSAGLTTFRATLAAHAGAAAAAPLPAVRYRWDFGDGSAAITSASDVAGHTYTCADNNLHTVRTEIIDTLGNVAIGHLPVDVTATCQQPTALDGIDGLDSQLIGLDLAQVELTLCHEMLMHFLAMKTRFYSPTLHCSLV